MAGHTFIVKAKAFLQRLFRKPAREAPVKEEPVKGQKVPLHILDSLYHGLSPDEVRFQNYLSCLEEEGKYERPAFLEDYIQEEKEAMKEEDYSKMMKQEWPSARVRRLWRYTDDGSIYVKYVPRYEMPCEVHGGLNSWVER